MSKELTPTAYRYELIQKEFKKIFEEERDIPVNTEAVMVLSAPPSREFTDRERREKNPENLARVPYGIEVIRKIVAQRTHKLIDNLSSEDLANGPFLLLNGDEEQIGPMKEIALKYGFSENKIILLDAGPRDDTPTRKAANTKTQFDAVNDAPALEDFEHITIITSLYHIPRVTRTADKNIRPSLDFTVLGVPRKIFDFDVYRKVKGETKRILQYIKKGDLVAKPRRGN